MRNLLFGLALFLLFGGQSIAGDSYDVVVVGGTPGGIAAAVAAARQGRSVALTEYHQHLGGMSSSGLGKSDIENRPSIQGFFREFVDRILAHYVKTYGADSENVRLCKDGYYYEPAVAERVFASFLAECPRITVLKGRLFVRAQVQDGRVASVVVRDRATQELQTLSGRVFIDATYEGDLYASAGAEFRLGRESRDAFDEPHAGVVYFDYQEKRFLSGTTGEGDDRLPAYTYRLCLTTDPENAAPLTQPPPAYDRRNYIGYLDDLKAGRLGSPQQLTPGRGYYSPHFGTLVRALSVAEIPNRKADVNINPRPLGFPFPEENRDYVAGDEATRERIRIRHRNLTLGLLWFLQNDPEAPEEHRRIARGLNLPKDEFADNGHFPFQLYVREARRLTGEYTLTEHDITGDGQDKTPRRHADSIALGEFPIDSFPCRKRQPGDTFVLEGYLGMLAHITRPYEIPYRIMIPRKVDGLIVPVAASTTHVAYSSIRMEPTWMALGQAAGLAAHLCLEQDVPPRKVSIPQLQRMLREQGQVLQHAARPSAQAPNAPEVARILELPDSDADPAKIDYATLPKLTGKLAVICPAQPSEKAQAGKPATLPDELRFQLHNYLLHHDGKFWCIWSDGPPVEDEPTQEVRYATSLDGLTWSAPQSVTGTPPAPYAYIARGLWVYDGELLALAAHFKGKGAFGVDKELELQAFAWDAKRGAWRFKQKLYDNAINNFPPQKLPSGEWIVTRRDARFNVSVLIGGQRRLDQWESLPVVGLRDVQGFRPDEPILWPADDGSSLTALFRDNGGSQRLFHATSADQGRSWTKPVMTNVPNASSKLFSLRTSRGYRVLVLNAHPQLGRRELYLAASPDGRTFTRLALLDAPSPPPTDFLSSAPMRQRFRTGIASLQYPHIIEHGEHLWIAFSRNKKQTELLQIPLSDIDALLGEK